MPVHHILDIAVYRCSPDQLTTELNKEKYRLREVLYPNWKNSDPKLQDEDLKRIGRDRHYSWKYNEIVGWIRLEVFGHVSNLQFRGKDYWIESKVIRRGLKKKPLRENGTVIEFSIGPREGSKTIFRKLTRQLEGLCEKTKFKDRYIDLESYRVVGQFINWRKLMDSVAWK
jgi:hypothetical protein